MTEAAWQPGDGRMAWTPLSYFSDSKAKCNVQTYSRTQLVLYQDKLFTFVIVTVSQSPLVKESISAKGVAGMVFAGRPGLAQMAQGPPGPATPAALTQHCVSCSWAGACPGGHWLLLSPLLAGTPGRQRPKPLLAHSPYPLLTGF